MSRNAEHLRRVLDDALAAVGDTAPPAGSSIATRGVLADLARAWPAPPGAAEAALHALCRKVAVAKQVYDEYERDWAKPADARPISPAVWRLLVAVLLAHASTLGDGATDRGLALKLANAAFAALDLAEARPQRPDCSDLRRLADGVLDELLIGSAACDR